MLEFFEYLLNDSISLIAACISLLTLVFGIYMIVFHHRLFRLGLKNLRRHLLGTILTGMATMVLVFMITLIWTVIFGLDLFMTEKSKDLKLIITEKWQIPSQLPITHANYLDPKSGSFVPEFAKYYGRNDFMKWSFYGGTMDKGKRDPANIIFFFAMDPDTIIPMMDDLQDFDPALVKKMKDLPQGCLLGKDKLKVTGKQIGERFKLFSMNYKDIDLEFEIVGELPEGRYNQSGIMNYEYFSNSFDKYARETGKSHPLAGKRLNLIWLRVPDRATFEKLGQEIEDTPVFTDRPVRVEEAATTFGSFLEPYSTIISGIRYLLVPAILAIMALVMANAISITVRERRTEMAVMKVLGFRPNQILQLVLGEAILIGGFSGLLAAIFTYALFNGMWSGIPFRVGFFPVFRIPEFAFFWGLAMGSTTAFIGSVIPAWNARSVRVSEVFARVA